MEKIIYADRLKAHYSWLGEDTPLTKKDLDDIVDAQPAADAVVVVRCKDCIFADPGIYRHNSKTCRLTKLEYDYDCYCSFGEKNESPNCGARMDGKGRVMKVQDLTVKLNLETDLDGEKVDIDHIRDLLAAERDGRLDVRPCSIGDTMYGIRNHRGVNKIQVGIVSDMHYTKNIDGETWLVIVIKHVCRGLYGDKVFSTYAEAKAALVEMDGEKEGV